MNKKNSFSVTVKNVVVKQSTGATTTPKVAKIHLSHLQSKDVSHSDFSRLGLRGSFSIKLSDDTFIQYAGEITDDLWKEFCKVTSDL